MGLSRKLLESMGLDSDKVSTIIEAHVETTDALKSQIAQFKDSAEKLATTEAELEKVKTELESVTKDGWEAKYNDVNTRFEKYKAEQAEKDLLNSKTSAYRELLKTSGVSDKRIDTIMKVTDLNNMEYADGAFKDVEKLTEAIKNEWGEFITQTQTQGVDVAKPPVNDGMKTYTLADIQGMTSAEINANWDAISKSLSKGE